MGKVPTSAGEKFEPRLVSTGKSRTTCAYFYLNIKHILYGSTHLADKDCLPVTDRSKYDNKFIWVIYEGFDIFKADLNGKIVQRLTSTKGYNAVATISPKWVKILFTSMREMAIWIYMPWI